MEGEAVSGGNTATYRPFLDGLRAVAVYLVVLYHSRLGVFRHGFIGVDIFFVLSGYLVTQLLLRDLAANGAIRLRRFYARRYRRLLPASFVVLITTAVVFTVIATAAEVAEATDAFRAAFLYVANWYFIQQAADYFAADIDRNPLTHFWSLAVEEQFYLAWPLLLGGLYGLTRRMQRPLRWLRGIIALAGLASMALALQWASTNLTRAYYGTDTRAYELLAGAFLALTPSLVTRAAARPRAAQVLAVVGLVAVAVLATAVGGLDPIERGVVITAVTSLLIVAMGAVPDGLVSGLLAGRGAVYLGKISYGTYLWHWPVIVLVTTKFTLAPPAVSGVAVIASTGLAAISFHLLEQPVRLSPTLDRHRSGVIAAGLALSIVGGLVLAPSILARKPSGATPLDWRTAQRDNPPLPDCRPDATAGCTVVVGSGKHMLLMGDSNARMYIPAFTEIARRQDLTLSVAAAPLCPWPPDVFFLISGEPCRLAKEFWYAQLITELDPDVIVLAQRPMDDPANPVDLFTPEGRVAQGTSAFDTSLAAASGRTIDRFVAEGRQVVIIEPIPIARKDNDPLLCLSSAANNAACEYQANAAPTPIETFFRRRANGRDVFSLDVDRLVCPQLPTCPPVVDGLIVKRDSNHITGTFSAHLAEAIMARLIHDGVLPAAPQGG